MGVAADSDLDALTLRLRAAGCVFAEDEAALLLAETGAPNELERMVLQRISGTPLEQVLGWAEFCGLRIAVAPDVFVPRRRSELLVRLAAARLDADSVVLELCCGSGAISTALLSRLPRLELHASDLSPAAVRCARQNLDGRGAVYEGNLFGGLPDSLRGRVDAIVANAPYVPTGEIGLMPPEARDYEPAVALDGGADGLDLHRLIAASAAEWIAPGGSLLMETSELQADVDLAILEAAGCLTEITRDDDLDGTAVLGRFPRLPSVE